MRRFTPLPALALAIATLACADDMTSPRGVLPDKPQLDHTTGGVPSVTVAVNNYHLRMAPDEIYDGQYHGQYVFFSGQVAYGTDGTHVFYKDTRGMTESFVAAGTTPFVELGTHADHYTAAMLFESDDQRGGERHHLDVVTMRESFAFAAMPDDDYVIVRYTMNNTTDADLSGVHLGFIADPDVMNAGHNATYFDASLQAAVTYDADYDLRSATILLDRPVSNYQHWVNASYGVGPDLSDPDSYAGWFALLSGGGDVGSLGLFDVRNALTTETVDIPAGGAVTLTVALVAGDDHADLTTNVAAARARFATLSAPAATVRKVAVALTAWEAIYTGRILFESEQLAAGFVAGDATCGQAPVSVRAVDGASVVVEFDLLAVDPTLSAGDRMYCTGRLADGSFFAGYDTPDLPDTRIHLTSIVTGETADWQPTWSPDGHTVAFMSTRTGASAIWILDTADPDAAPVQLTDGWGEAKPDWSPDGESILFIRGGGVWELDISSGAQRQLTATTAETGGVRSDLDARYSPDGSQVVMWRNVLDGDVMQPAGNEIWVMPIEGELSGVSATPLTSSNVSNVYPEWANDGLIYYTAAGTYAPWRIFSIDPAIGSASIQQVTPEEVSVNRHPAMSPDVRTLVFNDSRLIIQDMTLGSHSIAPLEPAVRLAEGGTQNLEFSPDGSRVIFATANGDIWSAVLTETIDPITRTEGLSTSIQSLVDAGLLDAAGGANLIAALADVAAKLEAGEVRAAVNKVNAFVNKVNALVRSRRLGEIEGELLIDAGHALAEQISAG